MLLALSACKKEDISNTNRDEVYAGGSTTVFATGADAYNYGLANLDAEGIAKHLLADKAFNQQYVTAPAARFGGLGPLFNQNNCISCHIRNGRGSVPLSTGDNSTGLVLRLSLEGQNLHGGPLAVPDFGTQLQTKTLFSGIAEGQLSYAEQQEIIQFLDGSILSISKPIYTIINPYKTLANNILTSPRQAPAIYGLGLLEAIDASDILMNEDIDDIDGNGISGKANFVWDIKQNRQALGRFGWKAGQPTAKQQAADAAHQDMGLTSSYFAEEHCHAQDNCDLGLQTSIDIDDEAIDLFAFYFQTVAVPAARNVETEFFGKGKLLFSSIGCDNCHKASYTTASHEIAALSNQKIYPYTDLLLHDMGEGLADNRPEFNANGREWRTPPLWGIGLAQNVNSNARFLHDGRAKSIEEAILWHGGEAQNAKEKYIKLSSKEREEILFFLKSI